MPAPHERRRLDRRGRSPDHRLPPPDVPDHDEGSCDPPERGAAPRESATRTASVARRAQAMTLRLYRALIRLLPREVRERDGEEMARTLADQIAGERAPAAVRRRALIRFPLVLALEWRDVLFAESPPSPVRSRGSRMESLS